MNEDPSVPQAGTYAVDYRDGSVGQVMGCEGGLVQLRPVGGGREWDCPPGSVGEAPTEDVLREKVREANRQVQARPR
ncbi:hypothetical protein CP970_23985 [Streptomyces kanamyceticus]|uniref:Uncharacterized protein n=1 Tax=Streptomyces kanamyceticus TaxID=1967 RepID=A0A5J6GCI8_STRKN|nr:hypothetical protein [Streptomyces kanamyceticus]QEU93560.1 hypothetical protein CP970_23985 [Streptomyces kanamyceticus]